MADAGGFTTMLDGSLQRWDRVTVPAYSDWGYWTRIVASGADCWYVECQFGLLDDDTNGWSPRVTRPLELDDRMITFRFYYTNGEDAVAIASRLLSDELSSWHMLNPPDKETHDG